MGANVDRQRIQKCSRIIRAYRCRPSIFTLCFAVLSQRSLLETKDNNTVYVVLLEVYEENTNVKLLLLSNNLIP